MARVSMWCGRCEAHSQFLDYPKGPDEANTLQAGSVLNLRCGCQIEWPSLSHA